MSYMSMTEKKGAPEVARPFRVLTTVHEAAQPVKFDYFRPIRFLEVDGQPAIDEAARVARVVIISEGLGNL